MFSIVERILFAFSILSFLKIFVNLIDVISCNPVKYLLMNCVKVFVFVKKAVICSCDKKAFLVKRLNLFVVTGCLVIVRQLRSVTYHLSLTV
jgi:hypothetical protein